MHLRKAHGINSLVPELVFFEDRHILVSILLYILVVSLISYL